MPVSYSLVPPELKLTVNIIMSKSTVKNIDSRSSEGVIFVVTSSQSLVCIEEEDSGVILSGCIC